MGTLRTILRRLFYASAAISLLLLLATLILWPVSHYRFIYAQYLTIGGDYYFLSNDGGRADVAIGSGIYGTRGWQFRVNHQLLSHWSYLTWDTPDPDLPLAEPPRLFLGVCWYYDSFASHRDIMVFIPFSYLAVLFCILPLLALRSIRRRRRARRGERIGLCPRCGYDLRIQRAGAGGAVCPECGTPVDGRIREGETGTR